MLISNIVSLAITSLHHFIEVPFNLQIKLFFPVPQPCRIQFLESPKWYKLFLAGAVCRYAWMSFLHCPHQLFLHALELIRHEVHPPVFFLKPFHPLLCRSKVPPIRSTKIILVKKRNHMNVALFINVQIYTDPGIRRKTALTDISTLCLSHLWMQCAAAHGEHQHFFYHNLHNNMLQQ